jgi:SulP family sulfate permease
MSMAMFLAIGIVAAAPLLGSVPVASLVGVMLLVCQSTFSWSCLRLVRKIPILDAAVIALVSIVTVQKYLAAAVLAGTIASALGFAYKRSTGLAATFSGNAQKKVSHLWGPLFFGSTSQFDATVVLDFTKSCIMDHLAVDAVHSLADKYTEQGKTIYFQGTCSDSTKIMLQYCQGQKSPPFQLVQSEYDTNADSVVYQALPL